MKRALISALVVLFSVSAYAQRASRRRTTPLLQAPTLDQIAVPQNLDICFSPEGHCDLKIEKFVTDAKHSLDVAIYDINLDQLGHWLLERSLSGVKVRVLVDHRQATSDKNSIVGLLVKAETTPNTHYDIEIRYGVQRGIMHNKFIVKDGEIIETGSFNYTTHASQANNENQIYLSEPSVVETYQKRFEKIWAQGKPMTADVLKTQPSQTQPDQGGF